MEKILLMVRTFTAGKVESLCTALAGVGEQAQTAKASMAIHEQHILSAVEAARAALKVRSDCTGKRLAGPHAVFRNWGGCCRTRRARPPQQASSTPASRLRRKLPSRAAWLRAKRIVRFSPP